MSDPLTSNPDRAIAFLKWLNSDATIYLERMSSVDPASPVARKFSADEAEAARAFVLANNSEAARRNLYFLPNAEFLTGTRKKANLASARFLHVDLDFKDYAETLQSPADKLIGLLLETPPKGIPAPTAVWFTGGGYQAAWRLADPIEVAQVEELNLALLQAFQGGLGTHNADRLLRLPGTVNWLNDKKRAEGRSPELAVFIYPSFKSPPVSYTATDFELSKRKSSPPALSKRQGPENGRTIEPLPLPDDLSDILPSNAKWAEAIATGENPSGKRYGSRSELVFACILWLLSRSVKPGHILSILTDPDLGISGHILDRPDSTNYARRQIFNALEKLDAEKSEWPALDQNNWPVSNRPENIRHAFKKLGIDSHRNMFILADEITGCGLEGRDLNDVADILSSMFSHDLGFSAYPAVISRELIALAHEQPFHPVLDYLNSLVWDGTARIDTWLRDFCGADGTELNREFGSKLLIAGVRRIKQPGVKFDTMLVLEGPQGGSKSSLVAKLAVREEWFCGSLDLKSDDKTKAELLARAWIVECQELDGLNKATSQSLKKFLSSPTDAYRKAYARDSGLYKRHCIIIGTTNEDSYLRDISGNRRIWPVRVGKIEIAAFSGIVDQLWAEAVVREAAGESIGLSEPLWAAAADIQKQRMVVDPFAEVLEDAFAGKSGKVSMETVKLLTGVDTQRMTASDSRRIKSILAGLGWDYGTYRLHDSGGGEYAPRKGFARGNPDECKVEHIAERTPQGTFVIKRRSTTDDDVPF